MEIRVTQESSPSNVFNFTATDLPEDTNTELKVAVFVGGDEEATSISIPVVYSSEITPLPPQPEEKVMTISCDATVPQGRKLRVTVEPYETNITLEANKPEQCEITPAGNGLFDVTFKQTGTFRLTAKQSGYKDATKDINVESLLDLDVTFTPDKEYIYTDKKMKIVVNSEVIGIADVNFEPEGGLYRASRVALVQDQGNNTYLFSSGDVTTGTIVITSEGYNTIRRPITVRQAETPTHELSMTDAVPGENLELLIKGVSEAINVSVVNSDNDNLNTNFAISKKSAVNPYLFNITATEAGSARIKVTGESIADYYVDFTFVSKKTMKATTSPDDGVANVGSFLVIKLTNFFGDVSAVSSVPQVVVTPIPDQTTAKELAFRVRSTEGEQTAQITFSGEYVNDLQVSCEFKAGVKEQAELVLDPASGVFNMTKGVLVTVNNLTKPYKVSVDDGASVEEVEFNKYKVTSLIPWTGNFTVSGDEVVTKQVEIKLIEQKEFYPNTTLVNTTQDQLPYVLKIWEIGETLTVASSNENIEAVWDPNAKVVLLQAKSGFEDRELKGTLTLTSETGHEDMVYVNIGVQKVLKKLDIDGKTFKVNTNQKGYVVLPMPDYNDSISVQAVRSNLNTETDPGKPNRVYFLSSTPGTYEIVINQTEYEPARITINVVEPKVVEELPPVVIENNVYDLGPIPEVTYDANDEDFINQVLEAGDISTDKEKCAYAIGKGKADIAIMLQPVCQFNVDMNLKVNATPIMRDGVAKTYRLASCLYGIASIDDYYVFRQKLRLLLKLFKVYKDEAFTYSNLTRFVEQWPAGDRDLVMYLKFVKYLTTYVQLDGQNVDPYILGFNETVMNKFIQFSAENLHP